MAGEELVEPGPLPFIEPFRDFAEGGEVAPVVLEGNDQLSRQRHEVVLDDAHDVEQVGHDAGVGEVAPDDAAVGAGEVDTDDLDALAPLSLLRIRPDRWRFCPGGTSKFRWFFRSQKVVQECWLLWRVCSSMPR